MGGQLPSTPLGRQSPGVTQAESSTWRAKGAWWWGGFLLFSVLYNLGPLAAEGYGLGGFLLFFGLLGAAISIAICFWWYDLSKTRPRRGKGPRILGYILFGLGSMMPTSAATGGLLPSLVSEEFGSPGSFAMVASSFFVCLLLGAAFLAAAYHLQFQGKETHVRPNDKVPNNAA